MNPTPVILYCPKCITQHIDEGEWATKPHRTHLCKNCQYEWRPSFHPTVGVASMSAETLSTPERIDRAMANTAVDDVIAGKVADPYKRMWSYMDKEQAEGRTNRERVIQMNPALGAPYGEKVTPEEVVEAQLIKDRVLQQIVDARRWRSLMACDRIRVLGTGSLGEKYAHIGLEIWGQYPSLNEHDLRAIAAARECLTRFVDGVEK